MDLFLEHWEMVNGKLAPAELLLPSGNGREDFDGLRGQLETLREAVTDFGVDRAAARAEVDRLMNSLAARLVEFNSRVRADLPGSTLERILPVAFTEGDGEGRVREALRSMERIWGKVNALTPTPGLALPLTLVDSYVLASFVTEYGALKTAWRTLNSAIQDSREAREERNDLQDIIYADLKSYREKVESRSPRIARSWNRSRGSRRCRGTRRSRWR